MKTDFETLKTLALYTVNHLKEHKIIEFDIEKGLSLLMHLLQSME